MISAVSRTSGVRHKPLLDAINLKINPPDSRCAEYEPQRCLLPQRSNGQPLQHEEVTQSNRNKYRQPDKE